jgi:hypothetical protein
MRVLESSVIGYFEVIVGLPHSLIRELQAAHWRKRKWYHLAMKTLKGCAWVLNIHFCSPLARNCQGVSYVELAEPVYMPEP